MASHLHTSVRFRNDVASHRHAFHIACAASKLHASGMAGKHFQITSRSSVPSCKPIVSVGSFSILFIAWLA